MNVDAAPRAHGQSQGTNWRWECVAKSGGEMIFAAVNRDKHMPYIVWWQQFSKQVHKNCDASTQMANWYNYSVLRNQDLQHQALSQMTKKSWQLWNRWTNATNRKRCRRCWSWYERDSLRSESVISMSSPVMFFWGFFLISSDVVFEDGRFFFSFSTLFDAAKTGCMLTAMKEGGSPLATVW